MCRSRTPKRFPSKLGGREKDSSSKGQSSRIKGHSSLDTLRGCVVLGFLKILGERGLTLPQDKTHWSELVFWTPHLLSVQSNLWERASEQILGTGCSKAGTPPDPMGR